jgi:DNA-binding GntR family transcriptional regulator
MEVAPSWSEHAVENGSVDHSAISHSSHGAWVSVAPGAMSAQSKPARRGPGQADRVTEVYRQLRELIIRGRLAPGTRIIETDVATRLGVSRTPVRSALQRLQQEGYIVTSGTGQQSRLSVAPLTKEDARELLAIVSEVEALAARWAALKPEAERTRTAAELRTINRELADTIQTPRPDPYRIFDLDQAFHRCFVEAGAGPRLLTLHAAIKPQTERYVRLYISALMDEISTSVREHDAAASAIEAGDAYAAKDAVLTNWHNATERLALVIERLGERGAW